MQSVTGAYAHSNVTSYCKHAATFEGENTHKEPCVWQARTGCLRFELARMPEWLTRTPDLLRLERPTPR